MKLFDVSTDSTSDLKKPYVQQRDIWFVPLTFTLEKDGVIQECLDDFEKDEEYIAFYKQVSQGWLPKTAKLNYEAHKAHFTKMAESGVKEVLHFTISSGLANTIEIAEQVAKETREKYPDFKVYAVDPLTATVGQGMLVGLACDCRDKGMTAKETFAYITNIRQNIQPCIIPNDLFYLKKGGRVSATSAVIGTMLTIKPMLAFDKQGKLQTIDKCKGMKKAFSRVIDCMQKAPCSSERIAVVVHTGNEKGANELATLIEQKTGVTPLVTIMGAVIGSHVGPGSVSCAWLSTTTREELLSNL